MEPLVQFEDLRVSFFTSRGEVKAVNGLSYELGHGEVIGIVGESGSGKSVSVNALMGLIPPPGKVMGGRMTFNNRDVESMSKKEMMAIRGKEIAMIFQDPMTSLNPVFTIGDQLMETIQKHMKVSRTQARSIALESLSMVRISNPTKRLKQYPHELSGGMRQRVMIAMALSCKPKLLIADEPTTALDVTIQAQILDLMKELKNSIDTSIILITHDLGIISDLCSRVIVMYAGNIVEHSPVDEIFYHPSHPYTQGLLRCLPRLDSDKEPLKPIEGTPVDLLELPLGCPFASRCDFCMKICINNMPPEYTVGENHTARCWRHHPQFTGEVGA